jgi:hypothetical protein
VTSATIGSSEFVYGICEVQNLAEPEGDIYIPSGFGHARDASLKRTSDREEIEDCRGDLRALLLRNPRHELQISLVTKVTVEVAEMASRLVFPIADILGSVLETTLKWQSKGLKMLDLDASSWDSMSIAEDAGDFLALNQGGNLLLNQGGGLLLNSSP